MERENNYKEILEHLTMPEGLSQDEAWKKLNDRIETDVPMRRVVPMWKKILPYTAAAACLVFVFWFFSSDDMITQRADNSRETIELPDGSKVYMNKYSEITYSIDDWSNNRNVSLKGEAFFEVMKGSKFTVSTAQGDVGVLGTSFNIFNRESFFEVNCYTGKVEVSHEEDEVILTPGTATKLNSNALLRPTEFEDTAPDWRLNRFTFVGVPLPRVIEELEVEFGVTIRNESEVSDEIQWTGEIINLKGALDAICPPNALSYEIKDDVVILKKR